MTTLSTSLTMLEGLRGGRDQRAWREFMRRYAPMLMAFAKRLGLSDADAGDAVQETLMAVHQVFAKLQEPFDRSKGKFKSWLHGVVRNKVRQIRRQAGQRERLQARVSAAGDERHAEEAGDPVDEAFELEWRRNQLAEAMRLVSQECEPAVVQAFQLYAVHGQAPEKVAALLGISRNAVYISKCRMVRRLRETLARLEEEEG